MRARNRVMALAEASGQFKIDDPVEFEKKFAGAL